MRHLPLGDDANRASINAIVAEAWGSRVDSVCQAGDIHGDVNFNNCGHRSAVPRDRYRIGLVPSRADCFQQRATTTRLTQVLAQGKTAVLTGLGGVGKTQLAADYAEKMWRAGEVSLLVWITANSRDDIVAAYASAVLELDPLAEGDAEKLAQNFLQYLATTSRQWLVVFDNLQKPDDLRLLWPPQDPKGRVLVTTCRSNAALQTDRREVITVGLFTPNESLSYLTRKLKNHSTLARDAAKLADDLGHLPLALAHAAAYMIDEGLDCQQYRQLLADQNRKLADVFPEPGALPDDYGATIDTTWALSIRAANELRPAGLAPRVLEIAAVLNSAGFPTRIFSRHSIASHLSKVTHRDVAVEEIYSALHGLRNLNLVTLNVNKPNHSVMVHTLVQRRTREQLSEPALAAITQAAADALFAMWPATGEDGELTKILRTNANILEKNTGEHLWAPKVHPLMFRFAQTLGEIGLASSALAYYQRLYNVVKSELGGAHPDTLKLRGSLAHWRGESGDFTGAIAAHEELLSDQERVLGSHHPDTLRTRAGLAHWTGKTGDTRGAISTLELLLVEILTDQLDAFGPDHPDSLRVLASLAHWRGESGDFTGAIAAHEELLSDQERVLGSHHPDTLRTRGSLAHWTGKTGDFTGAIAAHEELLSDQERVLDD